MVFEILQRKGFRVIHQAIHVEAEIGFVDQWDATMVPHKVQVIRGDCFCCGESLLALAAIEALTLVYVVDSPLEALHYRGTGVNAAFQDVSPSTLFSRSPQVQHLAHQQ